MTTEEYFQDIKKQVDLVYDVVKKAKAKGLDPSLEIEIPLAMTMAEKVVGLISTIYPQMKGTGIAKRILELEEQYGKLDTTVVFKIAEEVSKQEFCKFDTVLQAIDAGIRVGFAYITLGVVASPIEGYTELKIGKTKDGKEYFMAYFSGPIRSAGTTATCIALMLIDYLRELFGYAKYDPTEEEIKRYITENTDYHERVSNLQYFPLELEMDFLARNLPFQIAGEPTESLEVSNYKNLERVDTNFIRGGMCLTFSEGLAQKGQKAYRLYNGAKKNGVNMTGFDFLKEYIELHEKLTSGKKGKLSGGIPPYMKDLVAGRPIYGHPSRSGAFRFRYGRSRVDGFSAVSLNPATMAITDNFIAMGTQLKIEKPTKGCVTMCCDKIDGPIIKLINGSVRRITDKEEARKIYKDLEEVIYLGDMLFPYSDVLNRNAVLLKPGYVEEWWKLNLTAVSENNLDEFNISFEEAIGISLKHKIPLHPKYIFYWTEITIEQFKGLIDWIKHSRVNNKLILPYNKTEKEIFQIGKRALELLGIPHEVTIENVVVNSEESRALFANIGLDFNSIKNGEEYFIKDFSDKEFFNKEFEEENVLDRINKISSFQIKNKAGDFIGARMGRPEKAKLRKLTGSPNVLFPVGKEGGRLRNVLEACKVGKIKSTFPFYYCKKCDHETIYTSCENCNEKTIKKYYFYETKEKSFDKKIEGSEKEGAPYYNKILDVNYYFDKAKEKIGMKKSETPLLVKGIRSTSSGEHMMEHLSKGILRASYDLQVNKDGTIRYDAVEMPLVAFKPLEIGVSIEKLKELGYTHDFNGDELKRDDQVLELMPHDVLLPCFPDSADEKADDVFLKVSQFVDDLLVKFYGLEPFYNAKKREDLIGKIGICMAPHNCAGVICRFIGFSKTLGLMASPYMHAAIRRDCDGDEAAIMLLGDVLLNFSRSFLPGHRGGTQDAPLVLNARIDAGEVDDQILDFEFVKGHYPLELYEKAEKRMHSSEVKGIRTCRNVMKEKKDPFVGLGFTHDTTNFNDGVGCSSYKTLGTMQEKVRHQMELVEKLRAVDTSDTARLIIERHFMRDLRGNLRKFSMQGFRCVACNDIMRRPPLSGVCIKCGGKLIFTIHEGGIKKYLEPALELATKYNLSSYMKQNLDLVKRYIESIFGKELEKQEELGKWF
ncbi:MAG TPA: DNA polymerase II large subunit [Nanoarchaeota archaeon]|nr:DNA polymerase II large subunit [Nanoarchaeota archaeon]HIJ09129.1 DNA polymerase II large subunit [Nanoarchaeota archaeon]